MSRAMVPAERIAQSIIALRGHKVMLDADLAALYGVQTRVLNQAVKRNLDRFPADFMFQLSARELETWRSQVVISKPGARMGLRRAVFETLRELMSPPELKRRPIGFVTPEEKKRG